MPDALIERMAEALGRAPPPARRPVPRPKVRIPAPTLEERRRKLEARFPPTEMEATGGVLGEVWRGLPADIKAGGKLALQATTGLTPFGEPEVVGTTPEELAGIRGMTAILTAPAAILGGAALERGAMGLGGRLLARGRRIAPRAADRLSQAVAAARETVERVERVPFAGRVAAGVRHVARPRGLGPSTAVAAELPGVAEGLQAVVNESGWNETADQIFSPKNHPTLNKALKHLPVSIVAFPAGLYSFKSHLYRAALSGDPTEVKMLAEGMTRPFTNPRESLREAPVDTFLMWALVLGGGYVGARRAIEPIIREGMRGRDPAAIERVVNGLEKGDVDAAMEAAVGSPVVAPRRLSPTAEAAIAEELAVQQAARARAAPVVGPPRPAEVAPPVAKPAQVPAEVRPAPAAARLPVAGPVAPPVAPEAPEAARAEPLLPAPEWYRDMSASAEATARRMPSLDDKVRAQAAKQRPAREFSGVLTPEELAATEPIGPQNFFRLRRESLGLGGYAQPGGILAGTRIAYEAPEAARAPATAPVAPPVAPEAPEVAPTLPEAPKAAPAPAERARVTAETVRLPREGWRTPVIPGKEALVALQSSLLPAGRFYALDRPFESEAHDARAATREPLPPMRRIYDPDGLLGEPSPRLDVASALNRALNAGESPREAYANLLRGRGYDSYVRGIDGDPTNRELIVLESRPAEIPPQERVAAEARARPEVAAEGVEPRPAEAIPRPGPSLRTVPTESVNVAPERFQYKLDVDPVTGEPLALKEAKEFKPERAGTVQLWEDRGGELWVFNGHRRVALAKRTGTPEINAMVFREVDGTTEADARLIGALTNIAEGHGTAVDAAKVFRETGQTVESLRAEGLTLRDSMVSDALDLAKLEPGAFGAVVRGDLEPGFGAEIGRALPGDQAGQLAAAELLGREARRRNLSRAAARELLAEIAGAPRTTETTASLFGEETISKSLAVERAQVKAILREMMTRDKRLFAYVLKPERAARLTEAGTTVDVDRAEAARDAADAIGSHFDTAVKLNESVRTMLDEAARRVDTGARPRAVAEDIYGRFREEIEADLRSSLAQARPGEGVGGLFAAGRGVEPPAAAEGRAGPALVPEERLELEPAPTPQARAPERARPPEAVEAPPTEGVGAEAVAPSPARAAQEVGIAEARAAGKAALTRAKEKLSGRMGVGLDPTILADLTEAAYQYSKAGVTEARIWVEDTIAELGEKARPYLESAWAAGQRRFKTPETAAAKNAATAIDRAVAGMAPIEGESPQTFRQMLEEGARAVSSGDVHPASLSPAIVSKARPLSHAEEAGILYDIARIKGRLTDLRSQATAEAAPEILGTLRQRIDELTGLLDTHQQALVKGGRALGRAMVFRKALASEDTSLESWLQRQRVAKGRTLTEAEEVEINSEHAKLVEIQGKVAAMEKAEAARVAARPAVQKRTAVVPPPVIQPKPIRVSVTPTPRRTAPTLKSDADFRSNAWGKTNTIITIEQREAARARMLARASSLQVGLDPQMIADLAVEVGFHLEAGVRLSYARLHSFLQKEYKATDEEIRAGFRQATDAQRNAAAIERSQRRMAARERGEPSPRRMPPPERSLELVRQWAAERAQIARMKRLTGDVPQLDAYQQAMEYANISRTLLVMADLGHLNRQLGMGQFGEPRIWLKAANRAVRLLFSDKDLALYEELRIRHPEYDYAKLARLDESIVGPVSHLTLKEEAFIGAGPIERLAKTRIPVLKQVGQATIAGERSYTEAGNTWRFDTFYKYRELYGDRYSLDEYRVLADFLNNASGRGNLGGLRNSASTLSAIFFSPRWRVSRARVWSFAFKGGLAGKVARRHLGSYLGSRIAVLGLLAAAGVRVGGDPDKPEFGQFSVGDTKVDIFAGERPMVRYIARNIMHQYRKRTGKKDRFDPIFATSQFVRGMLAPPPAAAVSLIVGKQITGEPYEAARAGEIARETLTPIFAQDIYEGFQSGGWERVMLVAPLSFVGYGVQTYKPKSTTPPAPGRGPTRRLRRGARLTRGGY